MYIRNKGITKVDSIKLNARMNIINYKSCLTHIKYKSDMPYKHPFESPNIIFAHHALDPIFYAKINH